MNAILKREVGDKSGDAFLSSKSSECGNQAVVMEEKVATTSGARETVFLVNDIGMNDASHTHKESKESS